MILTSKNIRDRVINFNNYKNNYKDEKPLSLIEGFEEKNLQAASYDVTMSNIIKIFNNKVQKISLLSNNKELTNVLNSGSEEMDISGGYILKPEEFIRVKLNEYINMPNDLIAHIRPRSTYTRLGLILSSQHINPTYKGRLELGLFNASSYIIEIIPNLIIGQIVFEELCNIPEIEKLYENKKDSKYQNEDSFVDSKITEELKQAADLEYKKLLKKLLNE